MTFTTVNTRTTRPLRIAQIVAPVESVPPERYGGTERVVSVLTEELVRGGHEVTLFASGDSHTSARLVPIADRAVWHDPRYEDPLPFMMTALDKLYSMADEFDIIHNHMGFYTYPMARAHRSVPTVSTLHSRLDIPEWQLLYRRFADLPVVSISDAQRHPIPWANWLATIYHGIALDEFPYQPRGRNYLAFLGRISPEKGLDAAIRVAQRAGLPLKIGARMPLDQPHNPEARADWRYWNDEVKPLINLPGVEYVGEVGAADKAELLGGASALLFPIHWPEPFGLVMAEALACGTPVIGFPCGSVPEVIEDGVTGFVVPDEDGMVRAIERVHEIERSRCRWAAELRFSPTAMADRYEDVYRRLIEAGSAWLGNHGGESRATETVRAAGALVASAALAPIGE